METQALDLKKKDPDSFSLDPENPEVLESIDLSLNKRLPQTDAPILSPILTSPRLRKIDSFSQEDVKPTPTIEEISGLPAPIRITLNLCEALNKEMKTTKKINNFINTMDENLKLTEQLIKRQEKRIDEFFQEVFDLFNKNFIKMAEMYKQNLKKSNATRVC